MVDVRILNRRTPRMRGPWPRGRHWTTPNRRLVRFSSAATQAGRLADVQGQTADTVFTPDQVAAVESIRTVDGHQVFSWGGRWATTKDTMHFQPSVTPDELQRGLTTG